MAWISLFESGMTSTRRALRLVPKEPARHAQTGQRSTQPWRERFARAVAVASTGITLSAAVAHVLELPNKLALDAPLWLAVQQHLYRGWGPVIGPFEIAAVLATWTLVYLSRDRRAGFAPAVVAAVCMTLAPLVFFVMNAPVNAAVGSWTATTLPNDWEQYRLRWEVGHAITCALALTAFVALLRNADRRLGG